MPRAANLSLVNPLMGGMVPNMQWWDNMVAWFGSDEGWLVISTAILPFIAILAAGILAGLIARASIRRLLNHQLTESKSAAIAALVAAGRRAAAWNTLGENEQQHVDSLIAEADVRMRLLPTPGAAAAADWSAHQLASMKSDSASFTFQAEQTFVEFRDRLLEWKAKPKRARKLFAFDLERWRHEGVGTAVEEPHLEWESAQEPPPPVLSDEELDAFGDDPTVALPYPPARDLAPTPILPTVRTQGVDLLPSEQPSPPVTAGTVRQRITPDEDRAL